MLAPTKGSESRNAPIGTTVQTTASARISSAPVGDGACSELVATPAAVIVSAAPVLTSAASSSGSTRRVTPSATST